MERGLSLDSLKTVESCSIHISQMQRLLSSEDRVTILDLLEAAPSGLLNGLKFFRLYFLVEELLLQELLDPERRGWSIAKRLLGPTASPSLKSLYISVAWFPSYHSRMDRGGDVVQVNKKISSEGLEMLERCAPVWEDDARNVERIFNC